jgi:UDP-N-acetylmuramoyl-tripeptide--D-alanyl-D-alanine ligase
MAELGPTSERYHRELGEVAAGLGIEVVGVGEPARAYDPVAWAPTADEALALARARVEPGDAVLVKASRAVGLEGFADEIAKSARA